MTETDYLGQTSWLPGRPAPSWGDAVGSDEDFGVRVAESDSEVRRYRPVSDYIAVRARVSVVIPAMNEAANLPHVFSSLPGWIDEVILVDGRSTDDTVSVARRLYPDVKVVQQTGSGKGDALLAGFGACTGDIVVTMDADGSTDGQEIARFVATLAAGADYVKGSRFANGGGSADLTVIRRCGNLILSGLVNLLFGTRYTDLCYGFNAFWGRHLTTLALECKGFEVETLMNIRAAEAGLRVHEVPSFEHQRVYGTSNLRIVIDGWRIAKVIVREWRLHRQSERTSYNRTVALAMVSSRHTQLLYDVVPAQAAVLRELGPATNDLSA